MPQVSALQSLDLILEDVSAEINLSINALEQYSKQPDDEKLPAKTLEHLNKLKGVFTMLEMQGAERLVSDAIAVTRSLPKKKKKTRTHLLAVTTMALARLMRYTEHVNQKPYDLPQLLLPAINNLRGGVNASLLSESAFFYCDANKPRANREMVSITTEENAERSRHFRQMYQVGLIEVLRKTNMGGGLKVMQRALRNLDQICPRPQSPNLWWIAQALLDGFIEKSLRLTRNRLKLFSRIDRAIRQIENKSYDVLEDRNKESKLLTREMLYLVSISGASSPLVNEVLTHFGLQASPISDSMLREETIQMRGPTDQDYGSLADALEEEIANIRHAINNSVENQFEPLDLEQTLKQFTNLSSLLKILDIEEQTVRLSVAIDLLKNSISDEQKLSEKDIKILLVLLDGLTKAVSQSELVKHAPNAGTRRAKLSDSLESTRQHTYQLLQKLIKEFLEFTEQGRKQLLLRNITQQLESIRQGFKQLKAQQAVDITDACISFVNFHLIKNPHSTSDDAINLFADIISTLDFYLDTMEYTANPSAQILQFADDSLDKLKQETAARQSA